MRSDARVKFDSGVILLNQSQFLATYSKQCDCFILYRQQITSHGFFVLTKVGKGRLSLTDFEKKLKLYLYLFRYCIKQIDFMLPFICSSNRSQKTSKCRKNISNTIGYRLVSHISFLLLPHFDFIWTDARQHGIYLLNWQQRISQKNNLRKITYIPVSLSAIFFCPMVIRAQARRPTVASSPFWSIQISKTLCALSLFSLQSFSRFLTFDAGLILSADPRSRQQFPTSSFMFTMWLGVSSSLFASSR